MPTLMQDYLLNTRDQYYMEGGMRVYNLKEVLVTAKREKASSKSIYTGGINTYTLEGDRLKQYAGRTAYDIAINLPGVTVSNGSELHIRNNADQPAIVINDIIYDNDDYILKDIFADNISSISLLRETDTMILGPRAAAGAIVITLKDPKNIPRKPVPGIATYTPLGYCDTVEFYHPTYAFPEKTALAKSDLRTTIYWNPSLQFDNEGKATIEYYTADSKAPQTIIIEGVDKNGKVYHVQQTINK